MRELITIVERAGYYNAEREKIIQHMIDALNDNVYWDRDARNPDDPDNDEPMWDNNAHDMARTWDEFGWNEDKFGRHNPDLTDHSKCEVFQNKLRHWANLRFDEVTKKIDEIPLENGRFAVSRVINVGDWQPKDGLGIYWTFDYEGADIDDAPWGERNGRPIWLHGHVSPHDVDWYNTYLANMDWHSGDAENELRINKGAYVMLDRFEDKETGASKEVGRPYKA